MKARFLAVAALFYAPSIFAHTPEHFFDSLALHPAQLPTATVPLPPVVSPFDPTPIAAALAQNVAWMQWTQDNLLKVGKKLDDIAADEALEVGETLNIKNQITGLQAQIAAIPQGLPGATGAQGIPGIAGVSPTIQIGTVVSVPCSTPASVTNTGTATAAIFNFSIPTCGAVPQPTCTAPCYALSFSVNATRIGAFGLNGATVKGAVYIFTSSPSALNNTNPAGVASVCYWLDAPVTDPPKTCEGAAPWDFTGSATATTANPWNSATVANGVHTIIQKVLPVVGSPEIDTAQFTVVN